jgi:hypothetical protein
MNQYENSQNKNNEKPTSIVVNIFVRRWCQDLHKYETDNEVENEQFFFI